MTDSQQQIEFQLIRCPTCGAGLFYFSGPPSFRIRIKCRRCTSREKTPTFVIIQVSLESAVISAVDSKPENSACA